MRNRLISALLIVAMLFTSIPMDSYAANTQVVVSKSFDDVPESSWFYDSVTYVSENNIFGGTGNDSFSPYESMTRAMYITVMGRMAGIDVSKYRGNAGFTDVDEKSYYAPYVAWAVKNKITSGIGNGKFAPNGIVTREQMAVFTMNYFESNNIGYETSTNVQGVPKDMGSVSDWAKAAVLKMWKSGMLIGDNGNFSPKSKAIRAEAATICVRINPIIATHVSLLASLDQTNETNNKSEIAQLYFESNGGTNLQPLYTYKGNVISQLPIPKKEGSVFLAWYKNSSLISDKFVEGDRLYSTTKLYAKYMAVEALEEDFVDDSFSLVDQAPGLTFSIKDKSGTLNADGIMALMSIENTGIPENTMLEVSGSNGEFEVAATGGFTEGDSYKLTLLDEKLEFTDYESQYRKAVFTILKAEVFDVSLNSDIIYIKSNLIFDVVKNGVSVPTISTPLLTLSENGLEENDIKGSFTYAGAGTLNINDVLCIYDNVKPLGGADDEAFIDDDISYIKVVSMTGTTVNYGDPETEEVIFLPDVLPIYASDLTASTGTSFDILPSKLDFSDPKYAEMGLDISTALDVGDYVAIYTQADENADDQTAIYGEVTSFTLEGGLYSVNYSVTTLEGILASLEYYLGKDIDGGSLLEEIDVVALEAEVTQQVMESGFADRAADYMAQVAMTTDTFTDIAQLSQEPVGIRTFSTAAAPTVEDLVVKVKINTATQELNSGVRCAVTVSFTIPIEAGDGQAVNIAVSATFVEELNMKVKASGVAIWKMKWRIFPYIDDYNMTANVDVYNFTGVSIKSTIKTAGDTDTIDISGEMQKIIDSTKQTEIQAGVQNLFETYTDIMENESDWISIVEKEIAENSAKLLYGAVEVKTTVKFVVAANVNVALGMNFEYTSGTRYVFWAKLKAKKAGSNTIQLKDEVYEFQFYALGSLGLRMGLNLEFAVGLISADLNSIGITAESGVYAKAYGYFFYELKSVNGKKDTKASGALYLELGIYLEIAFKAQVLEGKFMYNPTLYENEWPLLFVGSKYNVYDFYYDTTAKPIALKDTIRTYTLPSNTFYMTYLNLTEGGVSKKLYDASKYQIIFSNNSFELNDQGDIVANAPIGVHKIEADMEIVWKGSSLAFSSIPISRTYHLVWDDLNTNGYTISFITNGGTAVDSITKNYEAAVAAPTPPTKEGYIFDGWYSDVQLTTPYVFTTMGWENIAVYAKWIPKSDTNYVVKHYKQDLNNPSSYSLDQVENYTGTTDSVITPNLNSYAGFSAPSTQSITIAADGSAEVRYNYTRNTYTLTFEANSGEGGSTKSVKYGAAISAPVVTKVAHTFSGWSSQVASTMPAENTTYIAQWTENGLVAYIVNHKLQDLSDPGVYVLGATQSLTAVEGTSVTPDVNAYTGFTGPSTQTMTIAGDGTTVIDYNYTRNNYTLTFDADGGVGGTSGPVKYGATINAPTVTREGYTFNGWSTEVASTMPALNTTYTARWIENVIPGYADVTTLGELNTAIARLDITHITVKNTITLTNGTIIDGLNKTITAETPGIDENGNVVVGSNYTLFTIAAGNTVSIKNLTLIGGSNRVMVNNGITTLKNVNITKSTASYGGAFINGGSSAVMVVDNCSVIGNQSTSQGGGAVENNGGAKLYIFNSTFSGNKGKEIGGAINNYGTNSTVYIINSTITGNIVDIINPSSFGGGIGNNRGIVHVINSVVAGNLEAGLPSDIAVYNSNAVHIYNSYIGAFVTGTSSGNLVYGLPATNSSSVVNPVGNGTTGIFTSTIPIQLVNKMYVHPQDLGSVALTGGSDVYFTYTSASVTALGYGTVPTYLFGSDGTKVTTYQGGSTRTPGVMGAYGLQE